MPDLGGLGVSPVTADLLTVLTLLESINRCRRGTSPDKRLTGVQ